MSRAYQTDDQGHRKFMFTFKEFAQIMRKMYQKCPLCLYVNPSHLYKDRSRGSVDYWLCGHCHLIFQDKSQLLDAAGEKARYETHNNDPSDERYLTYLRPIWNFAYNSKTHHSVLDFGCGHGKPLLSFNENVVQYDCYFYPDKSALEQTYDLIFCIETAEHFYKPAEEFKLLSSLLNTGGQLVLRTGMLEDIKNFPQWWYHRDPTHVCFYLDKTMSYIAENYGLEIVKTDKDLVLFQRK